MSVHAESGLEQSYEAEIPNSLTPEELLGLIAHAGPGGNLYVRSHYLADGKAKVGHTTYHSDFTKGPAIYYFDDPRNRDWISSVLPLGGVTTIMGAPKFSTPLGDRRIVPYILSGHTGIVGTQPIDPYVDGKYRFEILTAEEYASEEQRLIDALVEAERREAAT